MSTTSESPSSHAETIDRLREALGQVIRGKSDRIELLLVGLLGGGHVLLEDVPGVGKTTLAKALARCFSVDFARVQFTPDLLPADILGALALDPSDGSFAFHRGPIFTNVLLADEINRASPRTQSALLEAMNEAQVTIEGTTYSLPTPFCVVATQNPVDFHGTYPLPEAQLDRFLLRFALGYPSPEQEMKILFDHQEADPIAALSPVATGGDLCALQRAVGEVLVKPDIAEYLLRLVGATRDHELIELGVSTRGALGFFRAGQARALLAARSYASPDDYQRLAVPALAHRIVLTSEARYTGATPGSVIADLVAQTAIPV